MKRIVVGISGASGAVLGIELLRVLKRIPEVESHVVLSGNAIGTMEEETGRPGSEILEEIRGLADVLYDSMDMAAAISSGSFKTDGMVIIPCSMKTLAGAACGYSENLLLRAADVTLKEARKLVVVPREMPFGRIHLKNMLALSEAGAVIIPPVMTFYNGISSAAEMTTHVLGKVLDQFGIDLADYRRWRESL